MIRPTKSKPFRSTRGNKRVVVDGLNFMSIAESKRYWQLKLLVLAKKIYKFECQPRLSLEVNGAKVCTYIPDFREWTDESHFYYSDVKGYLEDDAKLKIALARALGYDIRLLTKETNPELFGRRRV